MLACLDLEGVLIPEIWIEFSKKTNIPELSLTTRDVPDYDVLMKRRLKLLDEHKLTLREIQEVIGSLSPLEGAADFLNWLRTEFQVIILSDTYYEFAFPLMKQLGFPTLFCHSLELDERQKIVNYKLRLTDQKTKAVKGLQDLNFKVIASGDSYNDTGMLKQADAGILFCPPENVIKEFPQFPVARNYEEMKHLFLEKKRDLAV
ncbi:MAG: bifunctional phosphoserine phosphatase/homoserine phosphotransferase ThrH [Deltaproteobacteria bacterium]|nr:bifunctional phosphoserine phosphatase/homoserine phosphotransferase ThrH [Deltaproteobacteria bacterium]